MKSDAALRGALAKHAPVLSGQATDAALKQLRALFGGVDVSRLSGDYAVPMAALTSSAPNIAALFSLEPPTHSGAMASPQPTAKKPPRPPDDLGIELQELHKPRMQVELGPQLATERQTLSLAVTEQRAAMGGLMRERDGAKAELEGARLALYTAVEATPGYDPLRHDHGLGAPQGLERRLGELSGGRARAVSEHQALLAERQVIVARPGGLSVDDYDKLEALDVAVAAKLGALAKIDQHIEATTAALHEAIAALPDPDGTLAPLKQAVQRANTALAAVHDELDKTSDTLAEAERALAVNIALTEHLPKIVKSPAFSKTEELGRLKEFNPYTTSGDVAVYRRALDALGGDDSTLKAMINGFEALKAAGATLDEQRRFFALAQVPNHWRPASFVAEVAAFEELSTLFAAEAKAKAAKPEVESSTGAMLAGLAARYGLSFEPRQQRALLDLVGVANYELDPSDKVQQRMHDEALLVAMGRVVQSGVTGLALFSEFFSELSAGISLTESVVGAAKRYSTARADGALVETSRRRDDGYENALLQAQRREYQLMAKHIGDTIANGLGVASLAASAHPPAAVVLKWVKYGVKGANIVGHKVYDWKLAGQAKALLARATSGDAAAKVELFKYSTKYAKGLLALGALRGNSTALEFVASRGLSEAELATSSFTVIRAFLLEAALEEDEQQTFGELYDSVKGKVVNKVGPALSAAASAVASVPDKLGQALRSAPVHEDEGIELQELPAKR